MQARAAPQALLLLLGFFCLLGLGVYSRTEFNHAVNAFPDSESRARLKVDGCGMPVTPGMRRALITYLTIEDVFRPDYVRRAEILIASFSWKTMGVRPIRTLGIGQIGFDVYLANNGGRPDDIVSDWIDAMSDDCRAIAVLIDEAHRGHSLCANDGPDCSFLYVCKWHAGDVAACLSDEKNASYVRAAGKLFLSVTNAGIEKSTNDGAVGAVHAVDHVAPIAAPIATAMRPPGR